MDFQGRVNQINAHVMSDGWAVFHTTGTRDIGVYRIEKLDETAAFESDEDVYDHVVGLALVASKLHLAALQLIYEENPTEWENIRGLIPAAAQCVTEID